MFVFILKFNIEESTRWFADDSIYYLLIWWSIWRSLCDTNDIHWNAFELFYESRPAGRLILFLFRFYFFLVQSFIAVLIDVRWLLHFRAFIVEE